MRRRTTYRVLLLLGTGDAVPLLKVQGGGLGLQTDIADRLNAEIARSL
jgi:hypothetical protein